jgi:hypothetical protein
MKGEITVDGDTYQYAREGNWVTIQDPTPDTERIGFAMPPGDEHATLVRIIEAIGVRRNEQFYEKGFSIGAIIEAPKHTKHP